MARLRFGRPISLRWNGLLLQGPANTVFEIPDEYYEEFNQDIGPVEPTLVWLDSDEGATLRGRVTALEGAGSTSLSNDAALALGTAASGTGTEASRDDHVHPTTGLALSGHNHNGTYEPTGTAVLKTIVDAKGDLIVGTAADTVSRLPVSGTNGYVLSADSSSATGLAWVAQSGGGGGGASLSDSNALALGTAAPGVASTASRYDHIHPTTGLALSGHNHDSAYAPLGSEGRADIVYEVCKNSSGATIPAYSVVYINGSDGTNPTIALADADTEPTSSKTLGFTETSSNNGDQVVVITQGRLTGVDTSGAPNAGSAVFLSSTAGGFTYTAPSGPTHTVYLGVVTKKNPSTGEIFVKVQNGYELDELHDVNAANPSDNDIIQWDSASQTWKNESLATAGIAPSASPTFTGNITTALTTAGYVKTNASGVLSSSASIAQSDVTSLTTDLAAKAPTANPTFTGSVTTPLTTPGYVKTNASGLLSSSASVAQADVTNLTTDLADKISKTIVDAKGDLIVATAADTVSRLAVSPTAGDVLTVDSSTATGLKWAAPAAGGVTATSTDTFQNKTIDLSNNTVSGNLAQFNAAVSDADLVSIAGTETLTNKTLTLPTIANMKGDYTTNVAASSTTLTLTSSSTRYQFITGSASGYSINLPDTSTIEVGRWYEIHNDISSANTWALKTSTSVNVAAAIPGNLSVRATCVSTADNTAASWNLEYVGASGVTGSSSIVLTNSPTISTALLSGLRLGISTVVSSGTTTSLSVSAGVLLTITGSSNHTVATPSTSGSGHVWIVENESTGVVTVQTSTAVVLATLTTGQSVMLVTTGTNATTAANFNVYYLPTSATTSQSVTFNQQTGTTYSVAASDKDKVVELNNAAAITVTVPQGLLATGDQITLMQTGAGQVTVVGATTPSAVTVNSALGLKLRAQWSSATLIKRGADLWALVGDTSA